MDSRQLYQLYQQHPTVTTDSRNCPEGSIFIALRGASFDGNLFADTTNVSINTALGRMRYALINMRRMARDYDMQLQLKLA